MDFFGVVAGARHHVEWFFVLAVAWTFLESTLTKFDLKERMYDPIFRLLVVTTGAGVLSFVAAAFDNVNLVFVTLASIAVIGVWAIAVIVIIGPLLVFLMRPSLQIEFVRSLYADFNQAFRGEKQSSGPRSGGGTGQDRQQRRRATDDIGGVISHQRALEIMELSEGASEQDIRAAYGRLMQKVHPDLGGSNFFAKQLNAARDVLLKQKR